MRSKLSIALRGSLANILTAITLIAPVTTFGQAMSCAELFAPQLNFAGKIDGSWRKYPSDPFMAFRANAPHFWNWLRTNKTALMQPTGIVAGDPHILNFGDIPMKDGGGKYALIDIDDAGVNAPLAGDFLRYTIGNQVSPFKVPMKELYKAYIDGVSGKKMDKPEYIEEVKSKAEHRGYGERQAKLISSLTKGNTFSEDAGVTPLAKASVNVQSFYEEVRPALEAEIKDYKILDVAFRTKETGGSQNLPRFWFLVEKSGEKHILEFKMEADPATSLYVRQPDAQARFQYVVNAYRPTAEPEGPYRFIQAGDHVFLLRERLYFYVDLDPAKVTSAKDIESAKEVSVYLANRIGLAHGAQPEGNSLKRSLQEPTAFEGFTKLVNRYISETTELNK